MLAVEWECWLCNGNAGYAMMVWGQAEPSAHWGQVQPQSPRAVPVAAELQPSVLIAGRTAAGRKTIPEQQTRAELCIQWRNPDASALERPSSLQSCSHPISCLSWKGMLCPQPGLWLCCCSLTCLDAPFCSTPQSPQHTAQLRGTGWRHSLLPWTPQTGSFGHLGSALHTSLLWVISLDLAFCVM